MAITIEQAEIKARSILDDYLASRWASVRRDFDETMTTALSEDRLIETAASITNLAGDFVSSGDVDTKPLDDHIVADIPLKFEQGELKFRVTFDKDGKVAGLFLLNPAVA